MSSLPLPRTTGMAAAFYGALNGPDFNFKKFSQFDFETSTFFTLALPRELNLRLFRCTTCLLSNPLLLLFLQERGYDGLCWEAGPSLEGPIEAAVAQ